MVLRFPIIMIMFVKRRRKNPSNFCSLLQGAAVIHSMIMDLFVCFRLKKSVRGAVNGFVTTKWFTRGECFVTKLTTVDSWTWVFLIIFKSLLVIMIMAVFGFIKRMVRRRWRIVFVHDVVSVWLRRVYKKTIGFELRVWTLLFLNFIIMMIFIVVFGFVIDWMMKIEIGWRKRTLHDDVVIDVAVELNWENRVWRNKRNKAMESVDVKQQRERARFIK